MIFELMLTIILIITLIAVNMKDLVHSVILLASSDVVLALVFLILAAPDIAITQIAITGGLSTLIFIVAIGKTVRKEEK